MPTKFNIIHSNFTNNFTNKISQLNLLGQRAAYQTYPDRSFGTIPWEFHSIRKTIIMYLREFKFAYVQMSGTNIYIISRAPWRGQSGCECLIRAGCTCRLVIKVIRAVWMICSGEQYRMLFAKSSHRVFIVFQMQNFISYLVLHNT